jgi:hypothetical protein
MKFEYKIITISRAHLGKEDFQIELSTKFNDWGAQGWDLIKMEPITEGAIMGRGATTTDFIVIFKRQIG